ncbi:MAG TPA: ABC transporter substrate-binding protein [Candidatus Binatia bacterium]|jgi:ABC-type nitrate/sulfonate/bicarbonate transport system substrate-binding protein
MKTRLMQASIIICCVILLLPSLLLAQPKPLRDLNVSYPLGGSSSYFWTAYRAGSFEKHGLKLNPVFIPGGVTALQSLMARELFIQLTAGPAAIRAWARGGKEITFIGAVGNRLDYVIVAVPSVRNPEELKGKRLGVSQLGASPDFIARLGLRQMGLNPERDVTIVPIGSPGERWAALNAGHVQASLFQPPFTLRARKAGFATLLDFSTLDFPYILSGVLTTRSFIRSDRETVMNFMRGLADGMDFYRDEKNKDRVIRFLGEYYKSNNVEELEETRSVYMKMTPGLPVVTVKSIENVIRDDKDLSGLGLRPEEMLDLSFLQRLEEERKVKGR